MRPAGIFPILELLKTRVPRILFDMAAPVMVGTAINSVFLSGSFRKGKIKTPAFLP